MPPPGHPTNERVALDLTQTLGPRGEFASGTRTPPVDPTGDTLGADELRVDDRYELLAEHGRGGLGRVMRARDRRLGRVVAVKELLRTSEFGEQLFIREAMITARLEHPGIVPVHEAGRWISGSPYYVMKLVSGRTLKEVLADTTSLAERVALLPHLIAVAEAVGYAHSESVVHRDLKPANVLIGEFGETVVIDWGLARDLRVVDAVPLIAGPLDGAAVTATVTGRVIGTPQYMAPEQARGESVGPTADVYALGAMLYELLAGKPAVEGDSVKSMLDQVHAGPPRALAGVAPGVPADLEAIVAKAMARVATDRYPTARELAADLKRFQTGKLVTAQHYGLWRLVRRWIGRNRGYVAMASLAAVAIAGVAIALLWRVLDERREAQARRVEAEVARADAEAGEDALVIAQANAALATDPTTALAWLKHYPISAASAPTVRALVDQAEAMGVASHIWQLTERARGVVLSPDGSFVAIGQVDGFVQVYDTRSGATHRVGDGVAPITALGLPIDGGALFVGDAAGRLATIDPQSGRRTELGKVGAPVLALAALTDGAVVVATSGELVRRDPRTGAFTPLYPAQRASEHLTSAWDTRSATVRIGHGADGALRRWRGDAPAEVVAQLPGVPHRLAMTDDGAVALVATTTTLYRVDLGRGNVTALRELDAELYDIVLDRQQRRAAIVGKGNDVYLIELATGAVEVMRGHADGVFQAAFDQRGDRLVTAGDEGNVRVWDLRTGDVRELRGHADDAVTVAISSDGRTVLSTSADDTMRLWRLDDRQTVVVGRLDPVHTVAPIGGDQVRVLTLGKAARVIDVDLRTRTTEERVVADEQGVTDSYLWRDGRTALFRHSPTEVVVWHDGTARTVRFPSSLVSARVARDGRTAISVDEAGRVWREDERGQHNLAQLRPGGTASIRADGRAVLVRDSDRLAVIDVETGAPLGQLTRAELGLTATALATFVPDEDRVVITGNADSNIGMRVWDPATGAIVSLVDSTYAHVGLMVSPDGRYLATGVESRALRLWDARTGAVIATLRGHRDGVFDLAFSPDSTRLATASYDRTVRIWDIANGASRVLSGHAGPVWSLAWIGDDQLVSASADGTVRRWAVPPQPAPDAAELRRRVAEMTAVEIEPGQRAHTPAR